MKAYGGMEVELHTFVTLAPDGGEWSLLGSLFRGKGSAVPVALKAVWVSQPVWTLKL